MSYGTKPVVSEAALDALGNPIRRTMLQRLADGPMPVNALAAGLPISRPAVSRHLAVLKRAKLVSDTSAGTNRLYALNEAGFAALKQWLEGFWADAEARFRLVAENTAPEGGSDD